MEEFNIDNDKCEKTPLGTMSEKVKKSEPSAGNLPEEDGANNAGPTKYREFGKVEGKAYMCCMHVA